MSQLERLALLLAVGCCSSRPARAPEAPARVARERGTPHPWGSVDWPSLRPMQCALSIGHQEKALRIGKALDEASLTEPERMWRLIYLGLAQDRLGRRAEAVASYSAAGAIFRHDMAARGIRQPLYDLKHLRRMYERCSGEAAPARAAGAGRPTYVEQDLPHAIEFELGTTGFAPGDRIAIERVLSDRPKIEEGAWIRVEGTWVLSSQPEASLSLWATNGSVIGDNTMYVKKGEGRFVLAVRMTKKGWLHVSYYSSDDGKSFGETYFGQGEGVQR